MLISGSNDGTIRFWDIDEASQIGVLKGHKECIRSLSIVNEYLVSGSWDNVILWNIESMEQVSLLN